MPIQDSHILFLEKIAEKDESAFEEFVRIYQNRVLNLIYSYVRSRQDAEELAQDVFVKIWNQARSFKGRSKVSTWVFRIAVNLTINYLKRKKIPLTSLDKPLSEEGRIMLEQVSGPKNLQSDFLLEQKALQSIIETAMENLPPAQKTAFILSKYEKHSYKEIAEIMNLSISAVESLLFRAKQNLRKSLQSADIKP